MTPSDLRAVISAVASRIQLYIPHIEIQVNENTGDTFLVDSITKRAYHILQIFEADKGFIGYRCATLKSSPDILAFFTREEPLLH